MTAILSNIVFSRKASAEASDEKYNYRINYEVTDSDKVLTSVTINASSKETGTYVGMMSYNVNTQQINAPYTSDMGVLTAMFSSILSEIKSSLQPVSTTTVPA